MKRGSALLIVLGVVSFMFVSAVGFAVYMRTSRMPSSYVRRNIAARHLVKAALAKAIGELDGDFNTDANWGKTRFYGIYDDPFPGILSGADDNERTTAEARENGDFWLGRVFMPFGVVSESNDGYGRKSLPTVSTLTLEALAYLPPAIIDDVRRLSRYTRTAVWRQLPYGIGRYAYCAVNVSDLFDINKLRASEPRDSGLNRITLAPLCMKDDGSIDTGAAGELDAILEKADPVPFVSLADFNLVAGSGSPWAPFMSAIGGQDGDMIKDNVWQHENALFITDTWFPPTNTVSGQAASYDPAHPFSSYTASSFLDVINQLNPANGGSSADFYMNNLGIGIACLYDYLDSDSKPISLTLPTAEAVPMIVGVSSPAGLHPKTDPGGDGEVITLEDKLGGTVKLLGDGESKESHSSDITVKRTVKKASLSHLFEPAPIVTFVAMNPFKRLKTESRTGNHSYYAKALLRVWLAPDGAKCRQADAFRPGSDIWQNENSVRVESGADGSFVTYVSGRVSLSSLARDVKTTDEALYAGDFQFPSEPEIPLYYNVTEEIVPPSGYTLVELDEVDKGKTKSQYYAYGDIWNNANQLKPWGIDGVGQFKRDEAWTVAARTSGENFDKNKFYSNAAEYNVSGKGPYRIYAAVWVQVLDGNGVVDMVPAYAADDRAFLGAGEEVELMLGSRAPLLDFRSGTDIGLSPLTIESDLEATSGFADWNSLYAVDPRYNFAPEDWFATESLTATANGWKNKVLPLFGKGGRDHDIFMFVSDQEYLQSIGELQFLPWIENLVYEGGKFGNYSPALDGSSFLNRLESNADAELGQDVLNRMADGNRFWKTYSAYTVGGNNPIGRDPYEMRTSTGNTTAGANLVRDIFPSASFKINPFSQDDRVISAAFAATPFDWYVASTNCNQQQDGGRWKNTVVGSMTLNKMMTQYSFGQSAVAQMSKDDLDGICDAFITTFRNEAVNGTASEPADWLAAYNDLGWSGNGINDGNDTFLGAQLNNSDILHGVDRKYLYSFWRECFDNRQQLFLIFVRAEPASVGGGGAGRVPSQMGGRAVVLVWRDPEPPATASGTTRPTRSEFNSGNNQNNIQDFLTKRGGMECPPHKTRVLFYHQFD